MISTAPVWGFTGSLDRAASITICVGSATSRASGEGMGRRRIA
jgi:hypothetical protein